MTHNKERIYLITGGTRGLGRAISLCLLKKGHRVIANYIRSEEEAKTLEASGCTVIKGDVSRSEDCLAIAEFIKERFGVLHGLINNAAIVRDELIIKLKEEDWQEIIGVNLKGVFNTIRHLAGLLETGRGHIINIASYSGIRGKAGQTAYSASKAGLIGLSLTAARELSPRGIKVNVVVPGYMDTDMGRQSLQAMRAALEESLLKTLTSPEEVAEFIAYLLTTETVTGQVFRIDSRI